MSLYNIALFLHIIGVLGVFIATAIELVILFRMRRAQTMAQVHEWVSADAPLGAVFSVLTLLILVAGIYMMFHGWNWTLPWIDVSFVALVLMNVFGATINSRRFKLIHRATQDISEGPVSVEVLRQVNDPVLWTSVLTIATTLIGVVYLMILKPDWLGTLIVTIIALALGFALGQLPRRRAEAVTTARA